jgi:hypothetical protein
VKHSFLVERVLISHSAQLAFSFPVSVSSLVNSFSACTNELFITALMVMMQGWLGSNGVRIVPWCVYVCVLLFVCVCVFVCGDNDDADVDDDDDEGGARRQWGTKNSL